MSSAAKPIVALVLVLLALLGACVKKTSRSAGQPAGSAPETAQKQQALGASALRWMQVSTPYPPADITAVKNEFWICGADEMIASSSDGGNSWKVRHSTPNGKALLHIAFLDAKIGHAAGKDGI